jgi:hypothetical protein
LVLAAGVVARSTLLLFVAAGIEGLGQGLAIGSGLAQINEHITTRRGEVTSTYFVLIYAALALPVIAVGILAQTIGLSGAALVFCGLVTVTIGIVSASFGRTA